jgi:uncharacterized protein
MAQRTFTRALVTGASAGIGEAFARQLAADGVALVLVARSTDRLQDLAAELGGAEVLTADLLDPADLLRVSTRLAAEPPVDLLVNNAGFGGSGPFAQADLDAELSQVSIHINAVMTLTHAALQAMQSRGGGGGVINVSSIAGFQPLPTAATYAACKAFETSFTESLRIENLDHGIHLTAVCPGFTDTAMVSGDAGLARLPKQALLTPQRVAREALDGVAANKAVVVPGVAWKAATALTGTLPRGATRALLTGARRLR